MRRVKQTWVVTFLRDFTGSFEAGLLVMSGVLLVTSLLALSLRLVIKME